MIKKILIIIVSLVTTINLLLAENHNNASPCSYKSNFQSTKFPEKMQSNNYWTYYKQENTFYFSLGGIYSFDAKDYTKFNEKLYIQDNGHGISSSLNYFWYNFASEFGFNLISFRYYHVGLYDVSYQSRANIIGYYYNHIYLIRPEGRIIGLIGLNLNRNTRISKNGIGGVLGIEYVLSDFISFDLRYELTTTSNHLKFSFNIHL
jgi:hypothetical protein